METSASILQLVAALDRFRVLEDLTIGHTTCDTDLLLQKRAELDLPLLRKYNGTRLLLPLFSNSNSLVDIDLCFMPEILDDDPDAFFASLIQTRIDRVESFVLGLRYLPMASLEMALKLPYLKRLELHMVNFGGLRPNELLRSLPSIRLLPGMEWLQFTWDFLSCEKPSDREVELLDDWAHSHERLQALILYACNSTAFWTRDKGFGYENEGV